jgi:hypothetical protein
MLLSRIESLCGDHLNDVVQNCFNHPLFSPIQSQFDKQSNEVPITLHSLQQGLTQIENNEIVAIRLEDDDPDEI